MTDLGALSLWVAVLMAAWGAALSFAGGALDRDDLARSGARGLAVSAGFTGLAAFTLWWAFVTDNFSLQPVATFSGEAMSAPFKLSAAWAQRSGVTLLFALACGACGASALRLHREGNRELMPWTAGMLGLLLLGATVTSAAVWNPFVVLEVVPEEGRGLDPRLQLFAAAIRIPVLCAGVASAAVALALGLPAAVRRQFPRARRRAVGTWTSVAWCCLSGSVLVALRLAYAGTDFGSAWIWTARAAANMSGGLGTDVAIVGSVVALPAGVHLNGGWRRLRPAARAALMAGGVLFACALTATTLRSARTVELPDGGSVRVADPFRRDWTFTSQGASRMERPDHFVTAVALRAARGAARAEFITSEFREYYARDDRERFPPHTITGVRGSLLEDVHVTLLSAGEGRAGVRIAFVPLAMWVWVGGVALVIGGALATWPVAAGGEDVT